MPSWNQTLFSVSMRRAVREGPEPGERQGGECGGQTEQLEGGHAGGQRSLHPHPLLPDDGRQE
jgi:hypothetical protein